jgi:hypothetical protein
VECVVTISLVSYKILESVEIIRKNDIF